MTTFGATFGKFWATFIPKSGHTDSAGATRGAVT